MEFNDIIKIGDKVQIISPGSFYKGKIGIVKNTVINGWVSIKIKQEELPFRVEELKKLDN